MDSVRRSESVAAVSLSGPDLTSAELEAVADVLKTDSLSLGPWLEKFEGRFADFVGAKHAVGVSSGTAGLHLGVVASGVGAGDLVITTPFSFIASANAILYERATPIFVDVDEKTGCVDPDLVAQAAEDLMSGGERAGRWLPPAMRDMDPSSMTLKAILPVHVFGHSAFMDKLMNVASRWGLFVIEDACEAVGTRWMNRPVGSYGDASVFSFYPNKQMTTGEGGILVTDRDEWARLFRSLRNQGREPGHGWLEHQRLGYNYRLDEMSAALGVVQLGRIGDILRKRAQVAAWYTARLAGVSGLETPFIAPSISRMSWFVYVVRVHPAEQRGLLMKALEESGIPFRIYFPPIHLQPLYVERFAYQLGDFPVAENWGDSCLALPFSGVMTEDQVDFVCKHIIQALVK